MSIEQQLERLIVALNANTQAVAGNAPTQTPVQPAQTAAPAPAQHAAAQATPPVAAQTAAASPSDAAPAPAPAPAPITLDQLKQEVTAVYTTLNGDPRVMAIVEEFAQGAISITNIPAEHYGAVLARVRALL